MDDKLKSKVGKFASTFVKKYDDLLSNNLKKADFDKTFTGFVSEKIERDDGTYRWRIQTNGVAYDIKPEMCNISCVGQRVRLYIPSHSYKDKYAEVIEDNSVICNYCSVTNDKIIYGYSNDTAKEVALTRDDRNRITSFTNDGKTIKINWHDD